MVSTSATKARAEFADLLNRVIYNQETVIIKRHGKPCAAVIPIHAVETIQRLQILKAQDRVLKALEDERGGKEPLSVEEVKRLLGLEGLEDEEDTEDA